MSSNISIGGILKSSNQDGNHIVLQYMTREEIVSLLSLNEKFGFLDLGKDYVVDLYYYEDFEELLLITIGDFKDFSRSTCIERYRKNIDAIIREAVTSLPNSKEIMDELEAMFEYFIEFNYGNESPALEDKVVNIDGVSYRLTRVDDNK